MLAVLRIFSSYKRSISAGCKTSVEQYYCLCRTFWFSPSVVDETSYLVIGTTVAIFAQGLLRDRPWHERRRN